MKGGADAKGAAAKGAAPGKGAAAGEGGADSKNNAALRAKFEGSSLFELLTKGGNAFGYQFIEEIGD